MTKAQPICLFEVQVWGRGRNIITHEWEDVPSFFDVVLEGSEAEDFARNFSKGSEVTVSGKLRWSVWVTPDARKRSKVEIVADRIVCHNSTSRTFGKQRDDNPQVAY